MYQELKECTESSEDNANMEEKGQSPQYTSHQPSGPHLRQPMGYPMVQPVGQPMVGSNTVIVQSQPAYGGQRQNITSWTTDICGCFEDCGTCCCALWCPLCHQCMVAGKLNETCCVPFCLAHFGLMAMRTKLRTAHGIGGSICGDYCCAMLCPLLVQCQLDREIDARGTTIF